jgi:hypothetical protein
MAKSGGKGHSKFLHTVYKSDRVARQKDCSPRFFLVCAAWRRAKRSISADLIFLVLFVSRQKGLAPRQLSGRVFVIKNTDQSNPNSHCTKSKKPFQSRNGFLNIFKSGI